jgi:protein-disulfide isomerase
MRLASLLTSLCALLLLPLAMASAVTDWTRMVVTTADGGYRMGNPDAEVKLVEYGSLTCSHCARFDRDAKPGLLAHVRTGNVSYEFRSFILNGVDVAATLTARCAAPTKFFPLVGTLFARQPQWIGRLSALSQAEKDKMKSLSDSERLNQIAQIGSLTTVARSYGVSNVQLKKCLANRAAVKRLVEIAETGRVLGVEGTPTFFINGSKLNVNDWPGVEAEIKRASG